MRPVDSDGGIGDFTARAGASIDQSLSLQVRKRLFVTRRALRLVNDGGIPFEAESGEGFQNGCGKFGMAARGVHVFDAHDPFAAVGACVKITADGGDERTEMQRSGRRWREPSAIEPFFQMPFLLSGSGWSRVS